MAIASQSFGDRITDGHHPCQSLSDRITDVHHAPTVVTASSMSITLRIPWSRAP
jgi:hypothetical protein